jgi:protein Tex
MSENKSLPAAIVSHIAQQLAIPVPGILATIDLLDAGGTVPFIARYRKEVTGNLDEVALSAIQERLTYFRELEQRRETILGSIADQGKLTPELQTQIATALDKRVIEDLYLPYRPRRRTKATIAREKGLEPLAAFLWNQQKTALPLALYAESFVSVEKGVASADEALEGARHILAEQISETAEFRADLRQMMMSEGLVVSRKREEANDPDGKFKTYYDYREPAAKIP